MSVQFGHSGPDKKTGGRAGSGTVEDVRLSLGVTRMGTIRNEYIRGMVQVETQLDMVWTRAEEEEWICRSPQERFMM